MDDLIANARRLAHDLIDAVVRVQYDVVADTLLALADECERQRIYVHELAEQSLALQAMYHEAEQDAANLAEAMRTHMGAYLECDRDDDGLRPVLNAHDARIGREGVKG